ncbi:hypothetical protein [Streptomyces sp. NPDC020983]|uniref:hypothetical protein n=1 Tax=Streptomyces sp. NPDC020983 TaxID=3365106 RepID=UPI00379E42B6
MSEPAPDSIAVASLKTHRLILTVPNEGPVDIASNMQPEAVANLLRYVADRYAPQPAPAPVLSDGERSYLLFALELAEDEMRARGTEFGDDDRAALASLRKLAGGQS